VYRPISTSKFNRNPLDGVEDETKKADTAAGKQQLSVTCLFFCSGWIEMK